MLLLGVGRRAHPATATTRRRRGGERGEERVDVREERRADLVELAADLGDRALLGARRPLALRGGRPGRGGPDGVAPADERDRAARLDAVGGDWSWMRQVTSAAAPVTGRRRRTKSGRGCGGDGMGTLAREGRGLSAWGEGRAGDRGR